MKKLSILFSLAFFAFVISASAQSSATTEQKTATTEQAPAADKAKSDDDMSKGCGAFSGKSAKAKCCAKSTAKKTSTEATPATKTEAVVSEEKTTAVAGSK